MGLPPVSRQGNLIVQSSHQVSNAELRKMLMDETRKQGKPFGLLIDDIAGGFTLTGRGQPQAFQVEPLVVYEVFPDGRPDMLVRGVDIVGTPLVSLTKIVATGDTTEVFNGLLRRRIGFGAGGGGGSGHADHRNGSAEEGDLDGPAADSAAACARSQMSAQGGRE